jgi:hypothetical protein
MSLHERALEHGAIIANVASTSAVGLAVTNLFTHWVNPFLTACGICIAIMYHGVQLIETKTMRTWWRKFRGRK